MPPAPPPSPFAWPVLLGAASMAFPALAAARARRSFLRDPAGQIAGACLGIGAGSLLGLGQVLGVVPRSVPVGTVISVATPLLLVPPLLAWLGGGATRWQLPAQLAIAAASLLGMVALGPGREFRLVAAPLIALGMTLLCAAVFARTVRQTRNEAPSPERLPVLGGLLTYFLTLGLSRPLVETLVGSNPQAVVDAHMGLQLVYAGCMTTVAWGVSHRATATAGHDAAAVPPLPALTASPPFARPPRAGGRRATR